ncbi:aminodeoxychorismate/anthranilate synthase component II [Methanocalculus taiwanensis]|uniref:anthranilate synthase n=1 Tax=Methanocalculus taiwanensis TaxID=106207 RepID=A0ABD4TJP4_9EURY|nr:aminodeoxychorismate/anthranilate synthase component II [Methanocalculus taiwanensis]MCQ1537515.1 aminodeoxychorismate/anthranilate synthase component II [Methanocalculus taiwanensis]
MRVVIVDCFDSFSYNLLQLVGSLGGDPVVIPADRPLMAVQKEEPDKIILSPGPGKPGDLALPMEVLDTLSRRVPTLGVCLGHQAICSFAGGQIIHAPRPVHGEVSEISHDGCGIYTGLQNPFPAVRYHSLVLDERTLPDDLLITAYSLDDHLPMGVRHRRFPIEGVQFHPESFLTSMGDRLIATFLDGGFA